MRITVMKDFIKILKGLGLSESVSVAGTLYRFPSGSFIKFIGLDKEDIGKGLRSDLIFVNEANKVPFDTFRELTSRSKRVIIDFNPNGEFWAHTEIVPREDADFLQLTYKDNEYLAVEERKEIEMYKTKAFYDPTLENYNVPSNVKSKYWKNKWDVYGLGIIGTKPNRIFFWQEIPDEQYQALDAKKYYGVDWGTVDPCGLLEAKYYDGALYFHEKNYLSENQWRESISFEERMQIDNLDEADSGQEKGIVKWLFNKIGVDKKSDILCDTNRAMKIAALWDAGYYALGAPKPPGSILDGIDILNDVKVYFTASSANLKYEQENYEREVDRYGVVLDDPCDTCNHLMDPARYVALWLVMNEVIKR